MLPGGLDNQTLSEAGDEADLDVQYAFGLSFPISVMLIQPAQYFYLLCFSEHSSLRREDHRSFPIPVHRLIPMNPITM